MSTHESIPGAGGPSPAPDPEHLLRARLRDTTPELEARFDELRRRLAHEPPRRGWLAWIGGGSVLRNGWAGAGAVAAALVVVAATFFVLRPSGDGLSNRELAAFGELVALDDALRDALPLADADTLDALLLIPTSSEGGPS